MKHLLFILLPLLASCNESINYFAQLDQTPQLCWNDSAALRCSYLSDSVKIGFPKTLNYTLQASTQTALNISGNNGYQIKLLSDALLISGLLSDTYFITLTCIDAYRKVCRDTLQLTVFQNLQPVAILSYTVQSQDGSCTLCLDGSASFDRDQQYGGCIVAYAYTIGTCTYVSSNPLLNYSVIQGQTYMVQFQVEDNNLEWSAAVIDYITI